MVVTFKKSLLHLAIAGSVALNGSFTFAQEDTGKTEIESEDVQTEKNSNASEAVLAEEHSIDSKKQPLEHIVVTGSRIQRDTFNSSAPIQLITTDKSALAGLISPSEILQNSAVASGQQIDDSFSGFVTDGGPGAHEISLRGLGGQRSLVLVNGRRWAPSGVRGATHSVDLTAIPTGLISRYEILKDGASSIYGADAVAGVVNAITRTAIDGAELDVTYRVPEIGAGEELVLDGIWGRTGDNWSVNFASSYTRQNEIVQKDLSYAKCPTQPRLTDQDGDGTIDNRDPVTGEELCFGFIYGLAVSPFRFVRFDPSLGPDADAGNPNFDPEVNGVWGIPYFTTVSENGLDNSGAYYRDTRDPAIAQVQNEMELFSFSSMGSYDFAINELSATAYYELFYNRRETRTNSGHSQFFPSVPATNPTNPFGVNSPMAVAGGFSAQPVLPSYNLLDPNDEVELDRYNFFAGLKGDLSATWTYDIYLGYGASDGTYRGDSLLEDQVAASLDAVLDADGNLVCRDLENNPGCVAANLFTAEALLNGRIDPAALAYISKGLEGRTQYDSVQLAGHTTGELIEMPAGAVMGVIGIEYRRESIDDKPDIEAQRGNLWGQTSAGRTKGADSVKEIYGELEAPLLANIPGVEELMLNLSGRWTDYDSFGDDTTYRAALNWQVIPSFRLRATKGTSFRAPDLYEQFLADQTGFASGLLDPCVSYEEQFEPGDVIYDNCVAQNLPDGFGDSGVKGIQTIQGGAETLQAETSDSTTYGFVWQPEELGVSVAVNWFEISIENTVQSLSASSVIGSCYSSVNFSSPLCSRIGERDEDGFISAIDASFVNVGVYETSGYDVDVVYEHSFNTFDLTIDSSVTYTDESSAELLGEIENYEGHWAFPHWRGDMDVTVGWKNWQFNWRIDYIGSSEEDPVYDPGTTNEDRIVRIDSELFHTFSARWNQGAWEVLAAVRNLTDKEPPLVADGSGSLTAGRIFNTIPGAGYPIIGRTFTLQLGYEF